MSEADDDLARQKTAESRVQAEKLRVEIEYLKLQKKFYPFVVGTGVLAALVGFLKFVTA